MPARAQLLTPDADALSWASSHLEFESSKLVSRAPWARIYRLNGGDKRAYLKLVPPQHSRLPRTMPALARHFAGNVPDVISADDALGLLMLGDPGGQRLDDDGDDERRSQLLTTYARLQARAADKPDLLNLLPEIDLAGLVAELTGFLDPSGRRKNADGKIGAAFFLGRRKAQNYQAALSFRAELLNQLIEQAADLPATVNHCDLRLKNAAITRDKTIVITNWDDATVGPAGLSLHALFSGCSIPAAILAGGDAPDPIDDAATKQRALEAYVGELVECGYASKEDLERSLPGTVCAGVIQHLTWFADYPDDDRKYQRRVGKIIESRLSDMLDLCDMLALRNPDTALSCARDYQQNGRPWRAESLLRRYLSGFPDDAAGRAQFARVLHAREKRPEAIQAFDRAIELNPDDADLHCDKGVALMEEARIGEAIACFKRARELDATEQRVEENLDRVRELAKYVVDAREVDAVPALPVSRAELDSGVLRPDTLALADYLYNRYGVLLIRKIFDKTLVDACREHFVRTYAGYFRDENHADALSIGDKRFQVTLTLEGPFGDPGLYGNPIIMQLMRRLLGRKYILGCAVCATSLPGSKDQQLHKDHRGLFTKDADDPPIPTPPFAITTMVPLVPLNEMTGTTTVRKGSHLETRRDSATMPRQVPIVPVGDCFLMDMRLSHQGLGNKTDQVRPIVNMVYQQRWFADNKNYQIQPPMRIPAATYERIPEKLKSLFEWTTHPSAYVNK